jgi:hypothetical protein
MRFNTDQRQFINDKFNAMLLTAVCILIRYSIVLEKFKLITVNSR